MATTQDGGLVVGGLQKTVKFTVTADNDELMADVNVIVHAVKFEGAATAVNIDSGADLTAFPTEVTAAQTLNVTTAGAGAVTVIFSEMPVDGYTTFDT